MTELPKYVLQRLQSAPAGEHPSADLVAAFLEQSLRGAEREHVLAHVAACSDCRELVWHSLPASEEAQTVLAPSRSRRWLWSPAFRLSAVAAVLVVMAGSVLLFYRRPGPNTIARVAPPPVVASQEPSRPAAPADKAQARLQAKNIAPKVLRERPARRSEMQASVPAPARTGLAGQVAGAVAAPAAPAEMASAKDERAIMRADKQQSNAIVADNLGAPALSKNAPAVTKKKLAPPTRWMVSTDGALLRSTDAGKDWQAVPFDQNVVFRAVATFGLQVWAGGDNGVLYYSADDGRQWQRVRVAADSTALTDAVTQLSLSDPSHVVLTTAAGQNWTTSDGGRSWTKQ